MLLLVSDVCDMYIVFFHHCIFHERRLLLFSRQVNSVSSHSQLLLQYINKLYAHNNYYADNQLCASMDQLVELLYKHPCINIKYTTRILVLRVLALRVLVGIIQYNICYIPTINVRVNCSYSNCQCYVWIDVHRPGQLLKLVISIYPSNIQRIFAFGY